jgi:hypothetical protein
LPIVPDRRVGRRKHSDWAAACQKRIGGKEAEKSGSFFALYLFRKLGQNTARIDAFVATGHRCGRVRGRFQEEIDAARQGRPFLCKEC